MKIEKLNKSSYRIRKQYHGVRYTVVVDHKPTQKEALTLMADELSRHGVKDRNRTFADLAEEYIESRSAILSPSTIRGYRSILKALPDSFADLPASQIDQPTIQKLINDMAERRSPKTVQNTHGLISAILGFYFPSLKIHTALPKKPNLPVCYPSADEIRELLRQISGTRYEIGFRLALYGLRRSEICALSPDDLQGNTLTINKAMVQNHEQKWEIKNTTKTDASTRTVTIDDSLADLICAQNAIFNGTPNALSQGIKRIMQKANLGELSMHKLRHFFASYSHELGISDEDIMAMGGWNTDHIMKSTYRHPMSKKESSQRYADTISRL